MIDCRNMAREIKDECRDYLNNILYNEYYLKIIQVDGDDASTIYTKGKMQDCKEIGLNCKYTLLREDSSFVDVYREIVIGNHDPNCIGIILQLPLPNHLKIFEQALVNIIDVNKDVDGFRKDSYFEPCTPKAIMHIIHKIFGNIDGALVTVIGRGALVGKPLIKMLDRENATVISCNSHTSKNTLEEVCRISKIIITATGKNDILTMKTFRDNVHIARESIIIDAGISRDSNGKVCGDCNKELYSIVNNITSVPGGVGLLTRAILMKNCIESIERQTNKILPDIKYVIEDKESMKRLF